MGVVHDHGHANPGGDPRDLLADAPKPTRPITVLAMSRPRKLGFGHSPPFTAPSRRGMSFNNASDSAIVCSATAREFEPMARMTGIFRDAAA